MTKTENTDTKPIIPTWTAAAQIYAAALRDGTSESRTAAHEGIEDMGRKMDQLLHLMNRQRDQIQRMQKQAATE